MRAGGLKTKLAWTAALVVAGLASLFSGLDRLSATQLTLESAVPGLFRYHADRSQALLAMGQEDLERANAAALRAVEREPAEPSSVAHFASTQLFGGDGEAADESFRVAALFGWRHPLVQRYWQAVAFQAGDYAVAADRMDAFLRVHPQSDDAALMTGLLEGEPAARAELIGKLAQEPSWLPGYLAPPADLQDEALEQRLAVVTQLAADLPLGCDAIGPLTRAALERGGRASAQSLWNAHCDRQVADGIVDADFAEFADDQPNPFGWQRRSSGDVRIAGAQNGGLVIGNSGAIARPVLSQAVAVNPGLYRARVSIGSPDNREALFASLQCGIGAQIPARIDGELASAQGQLLRADECSDQYLFIWARSASAGVRLRSFSLDAAN